ncbi:MAG: hypothetical protein QXU71_03120 [Candidatus Aenigmatarchaeota archaeon]
MQVVFEVSKENKNKVENIIKKDDLISRQSIVVRAFEDKFYFLIDGNEEAIGRAKDILKDIAKEAENKEEIIRKIKEEEEQALLGFGSILG